MADHLKFSEDHLWVRLEGTLATVGASDFLQRRLGEIVTVHLPDPGDEIERGEPFGELEAGSEVRELIAPLTGVVVAVNDDLGEHPAIVNDDPYHDGWLIEVEVRDEDELDELVPPDEYEELVGGESDDD